MNKDLKLYLTIGIIILVIIGSIYVYKYLNKPPVITNEELMKCIAKNSILYTSTGCPHCANQKEILGTYLPLFNDTDCLNDAQKCTDAGISSVPTWIIKNTKYSGVRSINELKQLTGC